MNVFFFKQAKQKWTIQASTSNLPSQGATTVVVKTEPVTSIDSGADTASNNSSQVVCRKVYAIKNKMLVAKFMWPHLFI